MTLNIGATYLMFLVYRRRVQWGIKVQEDDAIGYKGVGYPFVYFKEGD